MKIFASLNEEQKKAVETLDGPLLIVAGPGTGKTQLLSVRAANIMRKKRVAGENILILTYTNAAAKSVKERLAKIVGFEGYKVIAETFHGFANSVVLDSEEASEYMRERIQMTNLEKMKCLEYIVDTFTDEVKVLRPFGNPYLYTGEIEKRISELKNEGITPEDFEKMLKGITPDGIYAEKKHIERFKELAFIYKKYEELKTGKDKNIFDERGRYDYDDMIIMAIKILKGETELKRLYRERYKYVMVDEFQDTNGAQLELLFLLCDDKNPNLCSVGDDDQSIYRFQGASIANFRFLKERFPQIEIVRLKNNYRSTKEIIDLASGIIKQIPRKERLAEPKEQVPVKNYRAKSIEFVKFSTEDEEIVYIIDKIRQLKKIIENSEELEKEARKKPYNQIAVLVRKRAFILKLIDSFLKTGIPYATDGKEDISCQKRVRQLIDALKLARPQVVSMEEKDLLLYQVLSDDFLEIPHRSILAFINFVNKKKSACDTSLFSEFISVFSVENPAYRPTIDDTKNLKLPKVLSLEDAHKMHTASWAIQRMLEDAGTRPLHDILMGFIEDSNLYKFILRTYDKNRILLIRELRSLTSFINMAKNAALSRPELSLTEFLEELQTLKNHRMALEGQLVTATQDGARIITAHSAKGLEFHACFIPFCVQDKSWPLKPYADRIPLPPSIVKTKEKVKSKSDLGSLTLFDETRLFYVAASRARSNLIFTASPTEDNVESLFFNSLPVSPKENAASEEEVLRNFLLAEKVDTLLKDTNDVLSDIIANLVLTPTKLNNYLKCKRKFLYDNVLLLPGRKKQSLVFGNCVHKALEDAYRFYMKEKKFPDFDFFKTSFNRELRFQGVTNSISNWCLAKMDDIKNWFEIAKTNPIIPIDLEKKKTITLKGGIPFSGKYDKVEFEDEEKKLIRIIDYKTGVPDEHIKNLEKDHDLLSEECEDYLRQLVAYRMLYERDTYEPAAYTVGCGVLVFVEPVKKTSEKYRLTKGAYIDKKVFITDEMVNELEEGIAEIWKKIQSLEFEKLPEKDAKCTNCSFNSICWV